MSGTASQALGVVTLILVERLRRRENNTDPANLVAMSNMNFLSANSRCFSFDHHAKRYAPGEGVGAVVLQRLSDALRDGNCVRAVIRATGTNSNGLRQAFSNQLAPLRSG